MRMIVNETGSVFATECSKVLEDLTGCYNSFITVNCTAALEASFLALNFEDGDEVVLPSFTFASTANAIVLAGAKPVFVDVDPRDLISGYSELLSGVSRRTKAICVVHYGGFARDLDLVSEYCKRHGIFLIEDAAQAIGSSFKGRPLGTWGDLACFSFHYTKNIECGEGGCLLVNNDSLLTNVEIALEKGTNRSSYSRGDEEFYTWQRLGISGLASEVVCKYLFEQLKQLEVTTKIKRAIAAGYAENLVRKTYLGFDVQEPQNGSEGNGHIFFVILDQSYRRDSILSNLKKIGINASSHYVPLHSSPAGIRYGLNRLPDDSVTDRSAKQIVRLPTVVDCEESVDFIASAFIDALKWN